MPGISTRCTYMARVHVQSHGTTRPAVSQGCIHFTSGLTRHVHLLQKPEERTSLIAFLKKSTA
jgi:hypothetical protein